MKIYFGIKVVSMERNAKVPAPNEVVITNGWLRPRLLGHQPVLLVNPNGKGQWQYIYWKRGKKPNHSEKSEQINTKNRTA